MEMWHLRSSGIDRSLGMHGMWSDSKTHDQLQTLLINIKYQQITYECWQVQFEGNITNRLQASKSKSLKCINLLQTTNLPYCNFMTEKILKWTPI